MPQEISGGKQHSRQNVIKFCCRMGDQNAHILDLKKRSFAIGGGIDSPDAANVH